MKMRVRVLAWVLGLSVSAAPLGGCDSILGLGDLKDRPTDASADDSSSSGAPGGDSGSGTGSDGSSGSSSEAGSDGSSGSTPGDASGTDTGDAPDAHDASQGDADANGVCGADQLDCAGACVPNDVHNCGSCGNDCTMLFKVTANVACAGGACQLTGACADGWADCDGKPDNGCETDLGQPSHCGGCTINCPASAPYCGGSANDYMCMSICQSPTTLCGDAGACVNTATDPNNCGSCGTTCTTTVSHAQGTCVNSQCGGFTCKPGFTGCPAASPTACVDTTTDPANCGSCGNQCGGTTPQCAASKCVCTSNSCSGSTPVCDMAAGSCITPPGVFDRTNFNACNFAP